MIELSEKFELKNVPVRKDPVIQKVRVKESISNLFNSNFLIT